MSQYDGIAYIESLSRWNGQGGYTLEAIKRVMAALGDPQNAVPCIHVAGTNGKGSVTAATAAILGADGKKVGITVSPHLSRINERIVIDGRPIGNTEFDDAALEVRSAALAVRTELSQFEATIAASFLWFRKERCDFAVIETGLGGRLDATNIIAVPRVTVITGIEFDHTHILGNSLTQIAAEKAGIIKDSVPVVLGAMSDEPIAVIKEVADLRGAVISQLNRDFVVEAHSLQGDFSARYSGFGINFNFVPALFGNHQLSNMSCAISAAILAGTTDVTALKNGVENVFWPGRFELGHVGRRIVIVDAAHNPQGARALRTSLEASGIHKAIFLFGVLATKNWKEMLSELSEVAVSWHLLAPESNQAVEIDVIESELAQYGKATKKYREPKEALDGALRSDTTLPVVVTGSLYMIGKVREVLAGCSQEFHGALHRPLWNKLPN
jgi:dihydrofolate synthase/folylpolyglutamate synthase